LTDEKYFQGKLDYLSEIREAVSLPILRKDFIVDTYQVLEARVAGADAVLLIAECLTDAELKQLYDYIIELEMTPLVEFYAAENRQRVLDVGATLVGVNNRDLHTFETDLQHTIAMQAELPVECLIVAESGIGTAEDVAMLAGQGVDAMLVGESLMRQSDIGGAVENLLSLVNAK
jgi:indole-3-glycerol phosphate synthase